MPQVWDVRYEADALPTAATPPWETSGAGTASIASGILKVTDAANLFYYRACGVKRCTSLVKVKFEEPFDEDGYLLLKQCDNAETDTRAQIFYNAITLMVGGGSPDPYEIADPETFWAAYHTIRLVTNVDSAKVYLDEAEVPILEYTGTPVPDADQIGFFYLLDDTTYIDVDYWCIDLLGDFPPPKALNDIAVDYKVYATDKDAVDVREISSMVSPFQLEARADDKVTSTEISMFNYCEVHSSQDTCFDTRLMTEHFIEIWLRERTAFPWVKIFSGRIMRREHIGNYINMDVKDFANDLVIKGKKSIFYNKLSGNNSYAYSIMRDLLGVDADGDVAVDHDYQFNNSRGEQPQFRAIIDETLTTPIMQWFNTQTYFDILKEILKQSAGVMYVNGTDFCPSRTNPYGDTIASDGQGLITIQPKPDVTGDVWLIGIDLKEDGVILDVKNSRDSGTAKTVLNFYSKDDFGTPMCRTVQNAIKADDNEVGADKDGERNDFIDKTAIKGLAEFDAYAVEDADRLKRVQKPIWILCRGLSSNSLVGKCVRVWAPFYNIGSGTTESPVYEIFEIKTAIHKIGQTGGWVTELELQDVERAGVELIIPFIDKTQDKVGSELYEYFWVYSLEFVSGTTWKVRRADIQHTDSWEDIYTIDFSEAPFSNSDFFPVGIAWNENDDKIYILGRTGEFDNIAQVYSIERDPLADVSGWAQCGTDLTSAASEYAQDMTIIPLSDGTKILLVTVTPADDSYEGKVFASEDGGTTWSEEWVAPPSYEMGHGVDSQLSGICWDKTKGDEIAYFVIAATDNVAYPYFRIYRLRYGITEDASYESLIDIAELYKKAKVALDSTDETNLYISPLVSDEYYYYAINQSLNPPTYKKYIENQRGIVIVPKTVVKTI